MSNTQANIELSDTKPFEEALPSVGKEVMIDFVEGDPDSPVEIGQVYYSNNEPLGVAADIAIGKAIDTAMDQGGAVAQSADLTIL